MPAVVLGGPAGDSLVEALVEALERAGVCVVPVGLAPDSADDASHEGRFRAALAQLPGRLPERAVLGGFSVGGRIAARLCPELSPLALLCFGFPFHRAKDQDPGARHGLAALAEVRVPTMIIQGTRDCHGTEAEVRGYELPPNVELRWMRDGNHRFVPRARSGTTHAAQLEAAAAAAIEFVRSLDRRG